jgi:hypothetical protein
MHPPDKVFKGGEGVKRIVDARENDRHFFHETIRNKYWCVSHLHAVAVPTIGQLEAALRPGATMC